MLGTHPAIQLLFTDIVLPGDMNGVELALAARKVRPALRVLLTSGYAESAATSLELAKLGHPFIGKPRTIRELGRKLREVLQ